MCRYNSFSLGAYTALCTVGLAFTVAASPQGDDREQPVGDYDHPPIIEAARNGDAGAVHAYLDRGVSANTRGHFGAPALSHATEFKSPDIVALLIDRGADINAVNRFDSTALMCAAVFDSDKCADLLLKAGARTSLEDAKKKTALVLAAECGAVKTIAVMAKRDLDLDARTSEGTTALLQATECGQVKAVKALLDAGANPDVASKGGNRTALMKAADNGQTDIARLLVLHGADRGLEDAYGQTALDIARSQNKKQIVALLLDSEPRKPRDQDKLRRGRREKPRDKGARGKAVNFSSNIDDEDMAVDPALTELVLTFNQPMNKRRQHLTSTNKKKYGQFPRLVGDDPTFFRDETTFVLKVKLEPNTKYGLQLNEEDRLEFRSASGVPLEPMIFWFQTRASSARPTQTGPSADDSLDNDPEPADGDEDDVGVLFKRLMKKPTKENYLVARQFVRNHDSFKPYSTDLAELGDNETEEDCRRILDAIDSTSPNLIFSPALDLYAAIAAKELGDENRRAGEVLVMEQILKAILATGDGSKEAPYIILRVSDEEDVLYHLKKKENRQFLVREGGVFDVIECTDGTSVWFDIASFYGQN